MDVSYYYQILDTGICYEKGRKEGKRWKIGEGKRLKEEVSFWQDLLGFIEEEENGRECCEKLFESLKCLCEKHKLPNYERILAKKDELISSGDKFVCNKEEERKIRSFMGQLLLDLQESIDNDKDKEKVYRILAVLHNLPKSMHGRNILNDSCNLISYHDAVMYAWDCMDEGMREKYRKWVQG